MIRFFFSENIKKDEKWGQNLIWYRQIIKNQRSKMGKKADQKRTEKGISDQGERSITYEIDGKKTVIKENGSRW